MLKPINTILTGTVLAQGSALRDLLRTQARATIGKIKETHLRNENSPQSHTDPMATRPSKHTQFLEEFLTSLSLGSSFKCNTQRPGTLE